MRHARLASALAVVCLTATAAHAMPPTYTDVPSAVAAAKPRDHSVLVVFLDADDSSDVVRRELFGSLPFQAWADPRLVLVVYEVPSGKVTDPKQMTPAQAARRDFNVGKLPCFVFVDSDGYERGRLWYEGSVEQWLEAAEVARGARRGALRIPYVERERRAAGGGGSVAGTFCTAVFFLGIPGLFIFVIARRRQAGAAPGGTGRIVSFGAPAKPAAPAKPTRILHDDPTFGDLQVRDLRRRLAAGDWKSVEARLAAARDPDQREFLVEALAHWPGKAALAGDGALVATWAAAAPSSAAPHLLQGRWLVEHAWEARGGGVASTVTARGFELFRERLHAAEESLARAAELDPEDALAWAYRIDCGRGLSRGVASARAHFGEAASRHPWSRAAHRALLWDLCQKWHGSHAEMFAFARDAAANAPAETGLASLAAAAHAERWLYVSMADPGDDEPFRGKQASYWTQPDVKAEIVREYERSVASAGFVEKTPRSAIERNVFAFALWQIGETDRLRVELGRIGNRAIEIPWRWCGEEGFNSARKQVGLPPLPPRSGPGI